MLVPIGSRTLALGMDWSLAMSRAEVRARLKQARRTPATVVPGPNNQFWVGLHPGDAPRRTLSGAAVLGLVAPSAIVCQAVDAAQTQCWVCAIQDGKPVVGGYDAVLPRAQAADRAMEYMTLFGSAQLYGDLPGAAASVRTLLDQVEQGVRDRAISRKLLADCEVRRQGVSPATVLQAAAWVALPLAGFYGWKEMQGLERARQAAALQSATSNRQAVTAQQLDAERQRLVADFHASVEAGRAEFRRSARAGQVAPLWREVSAARRALPLSAAGGYAPTALRCTGLDCSVIWEGRGRFTLASDKRAITGQADDQLSTSTTTRFRLAPLPAVPGQASGDGPARLRQRLVERLQRTAGITVEAAQPVLVQPPPNLDLSAQHVGDAGAVRVLLQGPTALVSADHVIAVLDAFPVRVETIAFTGLGQGAAVAIDASYQAPHR